MRGRDEVMRVGVNLCVFWEVMRAGRRFMRFGEVYARGDKRQTESHLEDSVCLYASILFCSVGLFCKVVIGPAWSM